MHFSKPTPFYDADQRAVFFGYFAASTDSAGSNIPNQVVYTCLSHDIVAHEVTHALVDGLRPHYTEATTADTPGLSRGFRRHRRAVPAFFHA